MPLPLTIPGRDMYDSKTNRFITTKETKVVLEHSLISISKWESKWHKAYLSREEKTPEEDLDYIRCMCLTPNVDPNVFYALGVNEKQQIIDYIKNPMTATTFHNQNKKPSREIITNELIYFWMTSYNIPFDPCEKWHFNRLMTLIEVAALKNQPPKKMKEKDLLNMYSSLNAKRRAALGTRG